MAAHGTRPMSTPRRPMVAAYLALLLLGTAGACDGPPQVPGATPSGCSATIEGTMVGGSLASGSPAATLDFPADATIHITGTVTNHGTGSFAFALPWSLSPLGASGTVGKGVTATVDTTWTNGATAQTLTVDFSDTSGFVSDFEWHLDLKSTDSGCPPATPKACAQSGGNVFYATPTMVDGIRRQGCFGDAASCIAAIPVQLDATACDPDDIVMTSLASSAGNAAVLMIDDRALLYVADDATTLTVGDSVGTASTVVGSMPLTVSDFALSIDFTTTTSQGVAAVTADPGVVNDVLTRMPGLAGRNAGFTTIPSLTFAMESAMDTCVSSLPIDQVTAHAADFGLDPDAIDPSTGLVDRPGNPTRHVCELIPVYLPGGATSASGLAMAAPSLHIRDVLFGEYGGADATTNALFSNPPIPRPEWFVLTRADNPPGTTDHGWHSKQPYGCTGSNSSVPPTACDEFPFFSSAQGGPGAHLRIIDSSENSHGGSDYLSFTSASACNVAFGQSFAIVPPPAVAIERGDRSVRLCP